MKTPENQTFSGVFRGYKKRTFAKNWLLLTLSTFRTIFNEKVYQELKLDGTFGEYSQRLYFSC